MNAAEHMLIYYRFNRFHMLKSDDSVYIVVITLTRVLIMSQKE